MWMWMGSRVIGRTLLIVPLLVMGLAFGMTRPAAAAFSCNTALQFTTIRDSIVVPEGGICRLRNVVVLGGVTVLQGAEFRTADGTQIRGNVVGNSASLVDLGPGTIVRGNVSVSGGDRAAVFLATVRGNVSLSGVQRSAVANSTVSGSVVLSNAASADSQSTVEGNDIGVNLVCQNNVVQPYVLGNSVGNQAIGQCASDTANP